MHSSTLRLGCGWFANAHTLILDFGYDGEVRAHTKIPYGFLALFTRSLSVDAAKSSHVPATNHISAFDPLLAATSCACDHSANYADFEAYDSGLKV